MEICLWGDSAERTDLIKGNVILMKYAKVNVWKETKKIGTSFNTSIYINPNIIETTELM